MDEVVLQLVNTTRHMIEVVGTVVIPAQILLLMLIRRRVFQSEIFVNLACGGAIFLLYRIWNLGFGFHVAHLTHAYAVLDWRGQVPDAVWFIAHVLVGDLCFYLFHRLAHTRIFFLLDHSVHHSSTELNYTTNLRVSVFSPVYSWWPLLLPVLLGFDPVLLFACFGLANAVPFFSTTNTSKNWAGWKFSSTHRHITASITPAIPVISIKILAAC
ncbi:MAG: sterol desaturase family protein [Cellvibrionaceae bacterium]|nr:sterol desaturase family protein [Cellvibrionaceae bacterium]